MSTVVTVKSVKKTFIDFVDVVDASDESDADVCADTLGACTWPVSHLRRPSVASDADTDVQAFEHQDQDEGDSEAGAGGMESGAEEQCQYESEVEEGNVAEATPPPRSEAEAEAKDRVAPFIALPSHARATAEFASPLADQEASSPMWTWHNNVASFYCRGGLDLTTPPATLGTAMPSLPGSVAEPPRARRALQEPRFIPSPASSVFRRPTAQKHWAGGDSAYVEPSAVLSQVAVAASLPRSERTLPVQRQQRHQQHHQYQHQHQQQQQHLHLHLHQQQHQQQLQFQRVDPNRLERRRHPATRRSTAADVSALETAQARSTLMTRDMPKNYARHQQQHAQIEIQRADPNRLERRRHPAKKRDADADADAGAVDTSDAQTTIMIRNLPNNYTRDMLLQLLRSVGSAAKCDFLYLPIDFHTQSNLGYAFVNLESNSDARHFWQVFAGFNRWAVRSKKVASLRWSECQGLEANIKRYRNSPVMGDAVPNGHKPVVFSNGVQVEFPAPTKTLRAPRVTKLSCK